MDNRSTWICAKPLREYFSSSHKALQCIREIRGIGFANISPCPAKTWAVFAGIYDDALVACLGWDT